MGHNHIEIARGRPHEGRIELRENGTYRARIMLDRKRLSRTFLDPISAETWLVEIRKKHINGKLPSHLLAKAITLSAGMERLLTEMPPGDYRDDTHAKIRNLESIEPALCEAALADITRKALVEFIARRRANGRKPATINRDLTIIRSVYRKAIRDWGCDGLANPAASLTAGKEAARDRRPTPFELDALIHAAHAYLAEPTSKTTVPVVQMIEFAASTGLRLNEMGHLTWSDVNWQRSTVYVRKAKGGKKRLVPVFPSVMALLREMGGGAPSKPIFGTTNAVRKAWQRVRELAAERCPSILPGNDDNLRLHDLRHEAVSRLFERTDLPDGAIGAIVGHDDPRSTARYKNIRNADLAPRLAEAEKRHEASLALYPAPEAQIEDQQLTEAQGALRAAWRATSASKQALQRLVDRMPVVQVAKLYGISDVAVHKACKRLGVQKQAVDNRISKRRAARKRAGASIIG